MDRGKHVTTGCSWLGTVGNWDFLDLSESKKRKSGKGVYRNWILRSVDVGCGSWCGKNIEVWGGKRWGWVSSSLSTVKLIDNILSAYGSPISSYPQLSPPFSVITFFPQVQTFSFILAPLWQPTERFGIMLLKRFIKRVRIHRHPFSYHWHLFPWIHQHPSEKSRCFGEKSSRIATPSFELIETMFVKRCGVLSGISKKGERKE